MRDMMYGSWNIEHNRQNLLTFCTIFCPFTYLTTSKIKVLKKIKKTPGDIIILSVTQVMIICYTVPEIWHVTDVIFIFYFGLFFAVLPPVTTKTIKIFKKWQKEAWRYSLYICVPKLMITWCTLPDIWCTTDGWTDKWHIEVGASP